jgi:hypothetical protein
VRSPPQVTEWAGHSADVLLRVYARCISGKQDEAKGRILEATRPDDSTATSGRMGTVPEQTSARIRHSHPHMPVSGRT